MMGRLYRVKAQEYEVDGRRQMKYYACNADLPTEGIGEILERMQLGRSRVNDIKWAWATLLEAVERALERGYPVRLDGLCRISITCTSDLFDSPEEVTPDRVQTKRIVMRPVRKFCKGIEASRYIDPREMAK